MHTRRDFLRYSTATFGSVFIDNIIKIESVNYPEEDSEDDEDNQDNVIETNLLPDATLLQYLGEYQLDEERKLSEILFHPGKMISLVNFGVYDNDDCLEMKKTLNWINDSYQEVQVIGIETRTFSECNSPKCYFERADHYTNKKQSWIRRANYQWEKEYVYNDTYKAHFPVFLWTNEISANDLYDFKKCPFTMLIETLPDGMKELKRFYGSGLLTNISIEKEIKKKLNI